MRKHSALLALAATAVVAGISFAAVPARRSRCGFVSGEVLIVVQPGSSDDVLRRILTDMGGEELRALGTTRVYRFPFYVSESRAAEAARKAPNVQSAVQNFTMCLP